MLGFRAGRKVSDEHNAPGISGGLQTRSGRSGNQQQGVLLPEYLDDYVLEENPVRVVDAFIDELDLEALGFAGVVPEPTGRPAYHPAVLLKIYLYGYLNQVQSSRRLERERSAAISN
jgi:transposase